MARATSFPVASAHQFRLAGDFRDGRPAAILSRYVTIVAEKGNVLRMLQHNQAAVNSQSTTKGRGELFRERMTGLIDLLTEPGAPLRDRLRAGMALSGVSLGWMFFADQVPDHGELFAEVLAVACDVAGASLPDGPRPAGQAERAS
jgi:hypothetical protein